MNIHVELAKTYLADNDSVSLEELEANVEAAEAAREFASWAAYASWADDDTYWAAVWAAETAYRAAESAYRAAYWAAKANIPENAEYFKKSAIEAIKEYEELVREQGG